MMKTIADGPHSSIQGDFVKNLPGGKIAIRVDDTVHEGKPVTKSTK